MRTKTKKKVAEVLIIVILRSQQSINNTPCENAHSFFTICTHFVFSFFFGENKICFFFIAVSTNRLPSAYTFDNYSVSATIKNVIKQKNVAINFRKPIPWNLTGEVQTSWSVLTASIDCEQLIYFG